MIGMIWPFMFTTELQDDDRNRMYTHIIVDEGQDFFNDD